MSATMSWGVGGLKGTAGAVHRTLAHNLKRWRGVANLWRQSRKALELWMQIRSTAWTLAQLLTLVVEDCFRIQTIAPWRPKHTGPLA